MLEGTSSPPIVYLGPSLPLARAQALLCADYRPPVRRGGLPRRHDGTIVIIDGEFRQSLSVSPKEILRLLDDGTRVVGAASMGALKALELHRYGMEGCGWVFESYRSGRLEADDEVAVAYSPEDMSCLTVPLVNVRKWLDLLISGGHIDTRSAARLLEAARRMFYADRSEERLLSAWRETVTASKLQQLLAASGGSITDVKAADAEHALLLARRPNHSNVKEDNRGHYQPAKRAGHRGARASAGG
jgi:hypothetical protein